MACSFAQLKLAPLLTRQLYESQRHLLLSMRQQTGNFESERGELEAEHARFAATKQAEMDDLRADLLASRNQHRELVATHDRVTKHLARVLQRRVRCMCLRCSG